MKTYVGIARDHSGSMGTLQKQAKEDYNNLIQQLRSASEEEGIDTIVNTVTFGIDSSVKVEVINSSVNAVKPLKDYDTDGQTPLFDAVGKLTTMLQNVPDADGDVNFLVMVVTDGQENHSFTWNASRLSKEMLRLQLTDKWTFTFRVPVGYADALARMGIPRGNIIEWEQSDRGMRESTVKTKAAVKQFYQQRKAGITRSTAFYTDLSNVKIKDIRDNLEDISTQVSIWPVKKGGEKIKPFVEKKIKPQAMQLGTAFYQLSKPEKEVQDYKLIVIRNRHSGKVYGGREAREMIGLPTTGTIRLAPGDHGNFDVFIQSTSVNRKLVAGTEVLLWPLARSV